MTKSKFENTGGKGGEAVAQSKESARQCLVLADKFIREEQYERARQEVERAQKFDPSNVYIYAFRDRIAHFEESKKKSAPVVSNEGKATTAPPKKTEVSEKRKSPPAAEAEPPRVEAPVSEEKAADDDVPPAEEIPDSTDVQPEEDLRPSIPSGKGTGRHSDKSIPRRYTKPSGNLRILPLISVDPTPIVTKPPLAILSRAEIANGVRRKDLGSGEDAAPGKQPVQKETNRESVPRTTEPAKSSQAGDQSSTEPPASRKMDVPPPPPPPQKTKELDSTLPASAPDTPSGDVSANRVQIDQRLDEMRRQIEMLTHMLDQEKKAREEMGEKNVKEAVRTLRKKMETAWLNGAPKIEDAKELEEYAIAQGIPDEIFASTQREVKLELYSRSVKEVISKRKLLRSSSNTLEWLRKVYQVTLDEYLEYESKFLMDLVADQFKGTILLISADKKCINDIMPRLKGSGFAVVLASSPENALEKIDRVPPHFILCDVEFPDAQLSGTKFLHVIRANSKYNYLPFILLCEQSDFAHMSSYELRPTEAVVKKPVDLDELTSVMNEKVAAFRQYISTLT